MTFAKADANEGVLARITALLDPNDEVSTAVYHRLHHVFHLVGSSKESYRALGKKNELRGCGHRRRGSHIDACDLESRFLFLKNANKEVVADLHNLQNAR